MVVTVIVVIHGIQLVTLESTRRGAQPDGKIFLKLDVSTQQRPTTYRRLVSQLNRIDQRAAFTPITINSFEDWEAEKLGKFNKGMYCYSTSEVLLK
ncbi:unnamed protein product [Phytophthora fragariaefolia]|uniref:Unnamed protein product n=1 Tax=Phytophthora fragariaefolia TaxID=1490495 RepID=A0A9W6XNU7_9STRA|nr:unnamed protein product [Phytophthora fragariaefolia]